MHSIGIPAIGEDMQERAQQAEGRHFFPGNFALSPKPSQSEKEEQSLDRREEKSVGVAAVVEEIVKGIAAARPGIEHIEIGQIIGNGGSNPQLRPSARLSGDGEGFGGHKANERMSYIVHRPKRLQGRGGYVNLGNMRRFAIIVACCAGFYFLLFLAFCTFTDVSALRTEFTRVTYDPATESANIEIVKEKPAGWVGLGEVSKVAAAAIVLSEDWAFWQHNGFDWEQLQDAMETNLEKGKFARGGSTITQQVIKNVYLSNEKTITRKLKEAILTMRIERHVSKKRILEIYLNIAELGPGIYGINKAAHYYFQKSPASLTAKEGAFLAMLLPSPKKYSVSFRKKALTPYARSITNSILGKLLATQRLSQEEYEAAKATPLSFEASQIPESATAPTDEDAEEPIPSGPVSTPPTPKFTAPPPASDGPMHTPPPGAAPAPLDEPAAAEPEPAT